MMHRRRELGGQYGFALLGVILIIVVIIALGAAGYLTYKTKIAKPNQSSTPKQTNRTELENVTFTVSIEGAIGPACGYSTTINSQSVCFEPTDNQFKAMEDVGNQGYLSVKINANGYTDYEVLHGSAINSPGENTKVFRAVKINSITGAGTKYPMQTQ